ncbi:MAG: TIGR01777 family oxidoreductase [Bacteroidia bacterium]|nr:TIGR01777 family oxidoreductase [Bacteroidia bacterium]
MSRLNKIVLAGGSGYIGTVLCEHFKDMTDEIVILSRGAEHKKGNVRSVYWDGRTLGEWWKELEGADVLINLAGKNINCRHTEKNKKEILDSRVDSVKVLAEAFQQCKHKPKLWIQSASAGIYEQVRDRPMTESDGVFGVDFSAEVSKVWENAFWEHSSHYTNTRKVILRTSLVLGAADGAFPRLKNLVRYGLGGKQGNGEQWVSWVHEKDMAGIIAWVISHPSLEGAVNCASPEPLKNKEFMSKIRNVMKMPFGIPSPAVVLKMGAFIIGTDAELILKSCWALPEKILKEGYVFRYPSLEEAVKEIVQ